MAEVIWTDIALQELRNIHLYIYQYSVQAAENIVDGIYQSVDYVQKSPDTGTLVPNFLHLQLRRRVFKSYKIFYLLQGNIIYIITILHKARLFNLSENEIRSLID